LHELVQDRFSLRPGFQFGVESGTRDLSPPPDEPDEQPTTINPSKAVATAAETRLDIKNSKG
jgi:hypothetical protein